jgi:hypothetical protein
MSTKKGGIFFELDSNKKLVNMHNVNKLTFFLDNSDYQFLATGASGLIIKATLKKNINSPYVELGYSKDDITIKDRREILLKFCIVHDNLYEEVKINRNESLRPVTPKLFDEECKLQHEIYKTTNVCLESIVPYIFHCMILSYNDSLYKYFINKEFYNDILFNVANHNNLRIGLLVMATASDSSHISNFFTYTHMKNKKISDIQLKALGIETLLRFTLITQYVHGDQHYGNLLISNELSSYASTTQNIKWANDIRCYIIDFGRTKQSSPNTYKTILEFFKKFMKDPSKRNLEYIMEQIYNEGSSIENDLNVYLSHGKPKSFYGWIKQIDNDSIAQTVRDLIIARIEKNEAIRKVIRSTFEDMQSFCKAYTPTINSCMIKDQLKNALKYDKIEKMLGYDKNIDNTEVVQNIDNTGIVQNIDNTEVVQNIDNTELVQNIDNTEVVQNIDNKEVGNYHENNIEPKPEPPNRLNETILLYGDILKHIETVRQDPSYDAIMTKCNQTKELNDTENKYLTQTIDNFYTMLSDKYKIFENYFYASIAEGATNAEDSDFYSLISAELNKNKSKIRKLKEKTNYCDKFRELKTIFPMLLITLKKNIDTLLPHKNKKGGYGFFIRKCKKHNSKNMYSKKAKTHKLFKNKFSKVLSDSHILASRSLRKNKNRTYKKYT